jgi:hypothetical protein
MSKKARLWYSECYGFAESQDKPPSFVEVIQINVCKHWAGISLSITFEKKTLTWKYNLSTYPGKIEISDELIF